jgi:imidazolonepropionase-like amidohydrolase
VINENLSGCFADLVSLRAAGPDTILLRGATVHPVSGPDIADGSVLVRDGKIARSARTSLCPRARA